MILYSYIYHKAHVQCMVYNKIPGIPMALKLESKLPLSGIGTIIFFTLLAHALLNFPYHSLVRVRKLKYQVLKLNSFITVACYLC